MYQLNCIKCREKYESTDPDPYYCEKCNEEKKAIAAQIDAKHKRPSEPPMSAWKAFEESTDRVGKFVRYR